MGNMVYNMATLRNSSNFAGAVLVALVIIVALVSVVALGGCRGEPDGAPDMVVDTSENEAQKIEKPIQQIFDYHLVESSAGVRQWVLESDLMNKYSGQRDAELITVHLDFFKEGNHFSTLTSDSGRANLQTHDIFTWGNVVVVTDDGRRLETEELYFDNERQLIHNDVFDRFTRGDDVIEGIGLEATPDLEYIEIKRQVEADVVDSKSDCENPEGEAR